MQAPPAQGHYQQAQHETQTEQTGEDLSLPKQTSEAWKRSPITQMHRHNVRNQRLKKITINETNKDLKEMEVHEQRIQHNGLKESSF